MMYLYGMMPRVWNRKDWSHPKKAFFRNHLSMYLENHLKTMLGQNNLSEHQHVSLSTQPGHPPSTAASRYYHVLCLRRKPQEF